MLKLVARKVKTNETDIQFSKGQSNLSSVKIDDKYFKYLLTKLNPGGRSVIDHSNLEIISHSELKHLPIHLVVNQVVVDKCMPIILMDYTNMIMVTILLRTTEV